jgi:hypothetical protein
MASVKVYEIDYELAPHAPNADASERGAFEPRPAKIRASQVRLMECAP